MEAPDKIYLEKIYPDNGVLPNGLNYNQSPNDIEYVRTDAFIEKACDWLKGNITSNPNASSVLVRNKCVTLGMLVEDFKRYMED